MASSLALKRLVSSHLLPKYLCANRPALPAAQSATRFFNTNVVRNFEDGEGDDDGQSLDIDRRSNRSDLRRREFVTSKTAKVTTMVGIYVFDLFSSTRSLSQILNVMDKLMDSVEAGMRGRPRTACTLV
ncbi:hypothetical protein U1Q18_016854 [Sarracenia purpurea var. burkii]